MTIRRLPGWEWIPGNDAGTWSNGAVRPKLVLHTTEGRSMDSALWAYRANNSWPHATVDPKTRRRVQHLPVYRPARSLANRRGGVETNRAPTVVQVEIMGFSRETHNWPDEDLEWLGREVVGPLCRAGGVPIQTTLEFYGAGAGWVLASANARQRLSSEAWLNYTGVLGHQHAPENDHWDPGALNIGRVLAAARGSSQETGPDVPVVLPPARVEDDMKILVRREKRAYWGAPAGKVWVIDPSARTKWWILRPLLDEFCVLGLVEGAPKEKGWNPPEWDSVMLSQFHTISTPPRSSDGR